MMMTMKTIKIKLEGGVMPSRATAFDAAYDLCVPESVELTGYRQVIDLGFCMELPHGLGAIIQPRSGFSVNGIEALVSFRYDEREERRYVDADVLVGLVDEKYRGHVGVIIHFPKWSSLTKVVIPNGTRIAQMRIVEIPDTELVAVDALDMSCDRGGGFGHTGAI